MGGSSEELPPIKATQTQTMHYVRPTSTICPREWTPRTTALEAVASIAAPYAPPCDQLGEVLEQEKRHPAGCL
jgi:hypothetical protein